MPTITITNHGGHVFDPREQLTELNAMIALIDAVNDAATPADRDAAQLMLDLEIDRQNDLSRERAKARALETIRRPLRRDPLSALAADLLDRYPLDLAARLTRLTSDARFRIATPDGRALQLTINELLQWMANTAQHGDTVTYRRNSECVKWTTARIHALPVADSREGVVLSSINAHDSDAFKALSFVVNGKDVYVMLSCSVRR